MMINLKYKLRKPKKILNYYQSPFLSYLEIINPLLPYFPRKNSLVFQWESKLFCKMDIEIADF